MFKIDLQKELPRIPTVESAEKFWRFVEIGNTLINLHVNYEEVVQYPLSEDWQLLANQKDPKSWYITKMRFLKQGGDLDRSAIVVNQQLTLRGIPLQTYDYQLGPRPALEWILYRYRNKTYKPSGIINDPNDWGLERNNLRHIVELLKRVVTISLETVKLANSLPELPIQ